MHETDWHRGLLYSLGGSFLLSLNFVTATYGLKGFSSSVFSFVWTSSAAVFAGVALLAAGRRGELVASLGNIKPLLLMGVLTGVGMLCGWSGLDAVGPSLTVFLWRFMPVMVALLGALLLKEQLRSREFVSFGIMIVGSLISAYGRWETTGSGIVLALLGCLATAFQMFIAKSNVEDLDPLTLVFYRTSVGALTLGLWCLVTSQSGFAVSWQHWAVTVFGALLGPALGYLLIFRSYRHWEMSRSSVLLTLQPLFAVPVGYLILGTVPTARELAGGGLILLGGLMFAWAKAHRTFAQAAPARIDK